MKIQRYKLKDNTKLDDIKGIKDYGASWVSEDCVKFLHKTLNTEKFEISVDIGFPKDLSQWSDYRHILVLDEDFLQPYTPFYANYDKDVTGFPVLERVIEKYNEYMDTLPFLEKVV